MILQLHNAVDVYQDGSVVKGETMNKLTALKILADAYWHQSGTAGSQSTAILEDKFGHVRRSITLEDLKPEPKCEEGFNGRMPTHF